MTEKVEDTFLSLLTEGKTITHACEKVGLSRNTMYERRANREKFAAAWDAAIEVGRQTKIDQIEDTLDKWATEGLPEPVFYKGKVVGVKRVRNVTAALARLKALAPEVYGDKAKPDDEMTKGDVIINIKREYE